MVAFQGANCMSTMSPRRNKSTELIAASHLGLSANAHHTAHDLPDL